MIKEIHFSSENKERGGEKETERGRGSCYEDKGAEVIVKASSRWKKTPNSNYILFQVGVNCNSRELHYKRCNVTLALTRQTICVLNESNLDEILRYHNLRKSPMVLFLFSFFFLFTIFFSLFFVVNPFLAVHGDGECHEWIVKRHFLDAASRETGWKKYIKSKRRNRSRGCWKNLRARVNWFFFFFFSWSAAIFFLFFIFRPLFILITRARCQEHIVNFSHENINMKYWFGKMV